MIKCVLFDMDGVLIEAKDWHYEALNCALNKLGYSPITYEEHLNFFDGLPTKKKMDIYQKKYGVSFSSLDIEKINKLKQKFTFSIAKKKLNKDLKKIEMLEYLKSKDIMIACCSNSIKKSIKLFLKKAGIYRYFDFILSNQDVANPKPNPEIYLTAIERFNLSNNKDQVLIFEDNENGIKAAKSSGANLFVVSNPSILTKENVQKVISKYEKR